MLGRWNVICVLLLTVIHLTRVVSDDVREQEPVIEIDEDEKIPVSEHEFPKENVPTRPDYRGKGHWATPAPDSGISLGFVPVKMYAQVRRSHTVKHLPRSDAIASASSAEEIANAPRLREVVSTKKISEVYSEEGYEDSGYDHGGFAKEAEKEEGYDHHEGSKHKPKSKTQKGRDSDDSETQGTQTQEKQVDSKGELLKGEDSVRTPNTWMRHKVMRNEKRMMFVENKGEDGVPMKVMASYSHTIQHPGRKPYHKNQTWSTEDKVQDSATANDTTNVWNPNHQVFPSNVDSQALTTVTGKSNKKFQQEVIPLFVNPTGTEQNEDKSMNSYAQLKEQLYGSGVKKSYPVTTDTSNNFKRGYPLLEERVGVSQNKNESGEGKLSNLLNEQQYGASSVSVRRLEPQNVNPKAGFVPDSTRNSDERQITIPLDSLYQRKHPSIPLEEIQSAQPEIVPVAVIHSDLTRHFQHQDTPITSNMKEHPDEPSDGRYVQKTSLQERRDGFPVDSIVIGSNKTKHADRYTSKYKDIRKLENPDKQLKSATQDPSENRPASTYQKYEEIKSRALEKKNKSHEKLLPTPEDPLLLWAKFIEALTLAQYSKKGKTFKYPQKEISSTTARSIWSISQKPNFPNHSISGDVEGQDKKIDFNSRLREIDWAEGDATSKSLHNGSQSIILPFIDASSDPTTPKTGDVEGQDKKIDFQGRLREIDWAEGDQISTSLHNGSRSIILPFIGVSSNPTTPKTEDVEGQDKKIDFYTSLREIDWTEGDATSKCPHKGSQSTIFPFRGASSNPTILQTGDIEVLDKKIDFHGLLRDIDWTEGYQISTSLHKGRESTILPFTGTPSNPTNRPKELVEFVAVKPLSIEAQFKNDTSLTDLQPEESEQKFQESTQEGRSNSQDQRAMASQRMDRDDYGTPQYLSSDEEEIRLKQEEELLEKDKDKELHENVNEWKTALKDAEKGIIRKQKVNTKKYPFYKSLPSNTLSLYSPLRYAINPKAIPLKTEGGMEFYESREHIKCPEVTGPQDVVPNRTAPGEWNKKPKARLPRLRGLGDTIDCMRTKYFGSDPLDNPFFQEKTVGLPVEASSDNLQSLIDEDALGFYSDIMKHIRHIGDINNMPAYSMPIKQSKEFKNTAQQNIKHSSQPQTDLSEGTDSYSASIAGQYNLKAASSSSVGSNGAPGNNPPTENGEKLPPHSGKHPANVHMSPDLQKYRDIETDNFKYSQPQSNGIFSIVPGVPYSYPQSEGVNRVPELPGNMYKPSHQEIILGMLPPPAPTPSYLIMNAVTHTPKVYPTSILSLLNESPATPRPRKLPVNLYDYRNIKGLKPPSVQSRTKESTRNVYNEDNEITAASNLGEDDRGELSESPENGPIWANAYNVEVEPNTDIMVAQESSKPETVKDFQGNSVLTSKYTTTPNGVHHRRRRDAVRYDRRHYDGRTDDEESVVQDEVHRGQHRRLSTKKPKNITKQKRKSGEVKTQSARGRNSLDKPRRRMDYEDDLEYQYDDEDTTHNQKGKKFRKGNKRKGGSGESDEDVMLYTDYAGHESRGPTPDVASHQDIEEVAKVTPKKKFQPKSQDRASGSDSRRGEPRYYDKDERKKAESRISSRNRSDTKRGDGVARENKNVSLKKADTRRSARNKTSKPQEIKLKIDKNTNLSCSDSEMNGECEENKSEPGRIPSKEYYDDDEGGGHLSDTEESVTEEGAEKPRNSEKMTSNGFKNPEHKHKETDITLEETSKNNSSNKLKSKYSENVMSADQINRILGGFMSRHNPSYSSKYKAEETTVSADTTDSTTATVGADSSGIGTPSNGTDSEVNVSRTESRISSTLSGDKSFQKARVIPILNAKVIPELVTSTTKSPEINTNRRRITISRSADKKQSTSKSSKTNRAKPSRSKQESNSDDEHENPEEMKSVKEERSQYSAKKNISTASRDKNNVSRRRNSVSRGNGRKDNAQSEPMTTTTERTSPSRKRIPVRIRGAERDIQPANKDIASSSNTWRVSKRGRDNVLVGERPSSNPSQEGNNASNETTALSVDESENSTTTAPRRLQAIEHRRVTKEEIFTTTYYPEEELEREMERQSELDAADLESADESREKVIRDTSDEDDDEDVYEPFESYNYESRHVRYPGNRLQNEEYPYPDEDWNSKRGYFIYHEADNPSQNYNHKETKRRDNKSESYVAEGPQDTDVDGGGPSKLNRTSEDSAKIVTKSGVKGFYIQRSSDTATESSNPDRSKESVKEKSGAKVLTYVVDQKTGEGSWIPGVDDTKDVERDEGETLEIEEPKRANVRGSSKSRNSLRKQNGKERKALVNKEENPEDVLVTDMGNKEAGGDDRDRKIKTNRGKSRKEKRPSNQDTEEYAVEVNPDEIRDDSSLNPTNMKQLSQNRLRKHSGKYRQKDKTQRGEQLPEDTSGDDEERSKNSRRNFRKKDRENLEFESDDDDDDEKASDTYKFDRASKSRKSAHRRNRPGQYKSDVNQFKDTDSKIKSSASEIIYYEEAFPEATTHNEERKDGYKEETGDGEGDGEEYHEEGIASAPPERKGYSDDEGGDGRVQDFVKHPGDRFYYYVDEPEEDGRKDAARASKSYGNKEN